ncbi:MAG: sulfatase-like hydrolase/transferase [Bacteroidales bacterium]|jgi:phosphoglycerol transferase MdoB-like AlkP superfamily enzyme|nr:sulfatase-like hydrolase/transferase [Bacteroidales bacterium]
MFQKKEINEYLVLLYRIFLLMVIYSGLRLLFWWFNSDYFPNTESSSLLRMFHGGLKFDISSIMLTNLVYLLFYLFPLPAKWKFSKGYQKGLKGLFIGFNTIAIAASCIDLIYFRFINKRSTYSIFKSLQNEENMGRLWLQFLADYWYVFVLFMAIITALVYSYSLVKPKASQPSHGWWHYSRATVLMALAFGLSVMAIRGGYRHSTRPINMSNAGKYINTPEEMAIVLNSPFSILRNWGKSGYHEYHFFKTEEQLNKVYSPVHKAAHPNTQKNVVIFILESFNREYLGAFNKDLDDGQYKGYTPFLDSLAEHSLYFPNAYANGHKSIEAMPSIIASIPSLVLPYISSEQSSNQINSLASVLKKEGYYSAFFHGAQNGSMGFESFAKVAGFDDYFGRKEYNNEKDYDGIWGIWDEPYLQHFSEEMSHMEEPFYTTLFTLSSHHPFKIPEHYKGAFPKGTLPVHQCVGYTDNALRNFFKKASKTEWYKNTLFVFTADHSSKSTHDSYKTSHMRYAVPLLFFSPSDTTLQGRNPELAQQIDIMPTVLDYVGNSSNYLAFGQSLLQENPNKFIINYPNSTYQCIMGELVLHFDGEKVLSVHNYVKDPTLKNNIVNELSDNKLTQMTKAIVQQYNNRMIRDNLTVK